MHSYLLGVSFSFSLFDGMQRYSYFSIHSTLNISFFLSFYLNTMLLLFYYAFIIALLLSLSRLSLSSSLFFRFNAICYYNVNYAFILTLSLSFDWICYTALIFNMHSFFSLLFHSFYVNATLLSPVYIEYFFLFLSFSIECNSSCIWPLSDGVSSVEATNSDWQMENGKKAANKHLTSIVLSRLEILERESR